MLKEITFDSCVEKSLLSMLYLYMHVQVDD